MSESGAAPSPDDAAARRIRLIGIALMCAAILCLACLDATAKYLSRHFAVLEVVWVRYAGAFVLTLMVSNPVNRPGLTRSNRPLLQVLRAAFLLSATIGIFLSVKYLQLDQVVVVLFSVPLIVGALAGPLLGERVEPQRWAAILAGFAGVVLVARPGFGSIHPAAAFAVGGALCAALYAIVTRKLSHFDSNETTLFYTNLTGTLALLPVMPFVWTTPHEPLHLVLMLACGALGAGGQFLHISAHRHAPASVLSPFVYTQLVWMALLGFVLFGDVPSGWTLAGAAIVIASGLYLVQRERRRR